jgi:hypothetical protein
MICSSAQSGRDCSMFVSYYQSEQCGRYGSGTSRALGLARDTWSAVQCFNAVCWSESRANSLNFYAIVPCAGDRLDLALHTQVTRGGATPWTHGPVAGAHGRMPLVPFGRERLAVSETIFGIQC